MWPVADFQHLPPGRRPGSQSLRNKRGAPLLWWFCGIVGFGMFLGGAFTAAGGRGDRFPWLEELIGGSIFGLAGLFIVAVSLGQYRKFSPPRLKERMPGVNLAVDRDEATRGGTVSATITHGSTEGLEVGLVCIERYDLQSNAQTRAGRISIRQTNEGTVYESWQRVEPGAGEHVLTFEIPRDAPCSYEGDCLTYAWRVSARQTRTLQPDPRIDHPLWVRA
jgi:hypothetical protein